MKRTVLLPGFLDRHAESLRPALAIIHKAANSCWPGFRDQTILSPEMPLGVLKTNFHWHLFAEVQRLVVGNATLVTTQDSNLALLHFGRLAVFRFHSPPPSLIPRQNRTVRTKAFYDLPGILPFEELGPASADGIFLPLVAASNWDKDLIATPPHVSILLTNGKELLDMLDLDAMFGFGPSSENDPDPQDQPAGGLVGDVDEDNNIEDLEAESA